MRKRKLALLGIMVVLISIFATAPATAARSTSSSSNAVDITSISKHCAVVGVHLMGAQHTMTCRKASSNKPNGITPKDIDRDDGCNVTYDLMAIYNTSGGNNTILCFNGAGYMGVAIDHVNQVKDIIDPGLPNGQGGTTAPISYGEWFKWYIGGPGIYTGLLPGDTKDFGSGVTNVYVTQLCIGSSDYTSC